MASVANPFIITARKAGHMRCVHELKVWPAFKWNEARLEVPLGRVRHAQGRLLGRMETFGFPLRIATSLHTITADIVNSSAIEGENLNADEVRSSIARINSKRFMRSFWRLWSSRISGIGQTQKEKQAR